MPSSDLDKRSQKPIVLVFGGHDPSGGAGIAADISTLLALGCHPAVVITAVTVQNTQEVSGYRLLEPDIIEAQAKALLDDMQIGAFKTGMLGSAEIVKAVAGAMATAPHIPVVVDPVMSADRGGTLGDRDLVTALQTDLLPRATLITPNVDECLRLSAPHDQELDQAARGLLGLGCKAVLLTGTHAPTTTIIHRLYQASTDQIGTSEWPRLEGIYHGSGCTLAAAAAANLALGMQTEAAVNSALGYVWQALNHAYTAGRGQYIPDRLWRMRQLAP